MRYVPQVALTSIEVNMPIFHDQTVIDLAVEFDCIRFLAHCMVATQDSLYGDMEVRHGARGVEALKEKRRQVHNLSLPPTLV